MSGELGTTLVLVVDDDPRWCEVIQWALEDEGFAVASAGDPDGAVAAATARPPSVIVLDYGLPRQDGDVLAERLRGVVGHAAPIVLITADGRASEKAERVRAVGYLHKPFELDDLVSAVSQASGRA
jgi:DNA-binding response OmpR family regulator